jgi:hypothetical protein
MVLKSCVIWNVRATPARQICAGVRPLIFWSNSVTSPESGLIRPEISSGR